MKNVELRRHHAGGIMRWTPQIISKDNGAVAQIVRNKEIMMWHWQDCLDDNGWLDVASTIVSVNGRHFLILLYSILIYIVL